jgi:hypothetical protein
MAEKENELASRSNSPQGNFDLEKTLDPTGADPPKTLSSVNREEILKQYALPTVKVSFFTLLGYGDRLDFALQIVGSFFSIGAGSHQRLAVYDLMLRGGSAATDCTHRKPDERLRWYLQPQRHWYYLRLVSWSVQ